MDDLLAKKRKAWIEEYVTSSWDSVGDVEEAFSETLTPEFLRELRYDDTWIKVQLRINNYFYECGAKAYDALGVQSEDDL